MEENKTVSEYSEDLLQENTAAAGVMRILDASADRACEALRVIEDYVRFILDDAHLSGLLKNLRHRLTAETARFPHAARMAFRDTAADVGTAISTDAEFRRADFSHVLAANFSRLQEALRSLEEFSKISFPQSAQVFETLRYESYTLQKAVHFTASGASAETEDSLRAKLAAAKLYVLTDGAENETAFSRRVDALLTGGADVIQLRDKNADDAQLLARAKIIRRLITEQNAETIFIVNDRPDIAILSGAHGVHVGQEEFSVRDVRILCGPEKLVGVSTHSLSQARNAVLAGADYLGVGPTFPSATKSFADFPGLTLLLQVSSEIRLPAFAIGGITLENLPHVLKTGFTRVAVSSAITSLHEPEAIIAAVKEFQAVLGDKTEPQS